MKSIFRISLISILLSSSFNNPIKAEFERNKVGKSVGKVTVVQLDNSEDITRSLSTPNLGGAASSSQNEDTLFKKLFIYS